MDIKIVKALWGKWQWFEKEIPTKPLFNELVIVWGEDKFKYLSNLGYECILADTNPNIKDPDSIEAVVEIYQHKLEALEIAISTWPKNIVPAVHVSEPRDEKMFRAHHDYVRSRVNNYGHNIDIMMEAKAKELSVLEYNKKYGGLLIS